MTEKEISLKNLLDRMFEGVYFVDADRVITFWSQGAEELTGFVASEVTGRTCCDNFIMHVDRWGHNLCEKGDCPAQKTMRDGRYREIPVSYHHKDGHLVPAVARFIPDRDDQGRIVGAIEVFMDTSAVMEERKKTHELKKLALVDTLTEVANRRCAEIRIGAKLNEWKRYGWSFAVLFCDVDDFKAVNDNYGHEAGDQVLRAVARTLSGNLRSSDFVSRWGGDEFLVLLSNVDMTSLARVAEKVRRLVEHTRVSVSGRDGNRVAGVTASLGGVLARDDDTVESLLKRADQLMFASKKAGRNRVSL